MDLDHTISNRTPLTSRAQSPRARVRALRKEGNVRARIPFATVLEASENAGVTISERPSDETMR